MRGTLRVGLLTTLVVAGCSAPSPSSSSRASLTPLASPSASPSVLELHAGSDPLPPGRYTRSGFTPRITFTVDGRWVAKQLVAGFFDVQQMPGSPDVIAVQFAKPDAVYGADGAQVDVTDAAAAAAALAANSSFTVVETGTAQVGGLSGPRITVENPGAADGPNLPVLHLLPGPLSIGGQRRLALTFLDTTDGLLAVLVGGSVAQWEAALEAAAPVLASVTIGT